MLKKGNSEILIKTESDIKVLKKIKRRQNSMDQREAQLNCTVTLSIGWPVEKKNPGDLDARNSFLSVSQELCFLTFS